jgi:hypothetical protein
LAGSHQWQCGHARGGRGRKLHGSGSADGGRWPGGRASVGKEDEAKVA